LAANMKALIPITSLRPSGQSAYPLRDTSGISEGTT
jgi:hypothetical protein